MYVTEISVYKLANVQISTGSVHYLQLLYKLAHIIAQLQLQYDAVFQR